MASDPVVAAVTSKFADKPQEALRKDLSFYEEELKLAQTIEISIDLVLAAKRQLGFLRTIDSISSLHSYGPAVLQAIQRWEFCRKDVRWHYQRLCLIPQKPLNRLYCLSCDPAKHSACSQCVFFFDLRVTYQDQSLMCLLSFNCFLGIKIAGCLWRPRRKILIAILVMRRKVLLFLQ